ncbi:MAG: terminase TerL endonuclease subunit [Pseudomonadota bacterium]
MQPIDHPVATYAIDVLEGRIPAGRLVGLACERHLDDLENGADRGLVFDCAAADRHLKSIRYLKHSTGPLGGQRLEFQPWQVFRHGSIFGWKGPDGHRRFRTGYNQIAKKNGKTTDAVAMVYSMLCWDGEAAPQIYSAATTRDQAGLLFNEAMRMRDISIYRSSDITHKLKGEISCPRTQGVFKCLSRDGDSSDGINPHLAVKDEVHRWTDRELAEVITQSMIARAQPLDWLITTAGEDLATYCGETRLYSEKVLTGEHADDSFFAYVAEPPGDCAPDDRDAWAMANPNLGITFGPEVIADLCRNAEVITARMPNFRRLHLNLWTAGALQWISDAAWSHLGPAFDWRKLKGRPAWIAIDLSSTTDLSAVVVAVPVGDVIYLITFSHIAVGLDGLAGRAAREKREFTGWAQQGFLEVHPGAISEDRIIEQVLELSEIFEVIEVSFDRWGMQSIKKALTDAGAPMVDHGQGYGGMSAPMKAFEAGVLNERIRHGGNPVLTWAVKNVFRDQDPAEQIKPNKKKSSGRIDPAVAAIMAYGGAVIERGLPPRLS